MLQEKAREGLYPNRIRYLLKGQSISGVSWGLRRHRQAYSSHFQLTHLLRWARKGEYLHREHTVLCSVTEAGDGGAHLNASIRKAEADNLCLKIQNKILATGRESLTATSE